jgi:hypothetical protein
MSDKQELRIVVCIYVFFQGIRQTIFKLKYFSKTKEDVEQKMEEL